MNEYLFALVLAFAIQIVFFAFAAWFKTDKVTDLSYGLSFIIIVVWMLLRQPVLSWIHVLVALLVVLWGLRLAGYLLVRIMHMGKDARFDGIRENVWKFAGFWFFQAITVWLVLLPALYIIQQPIFLTYWLWIGLFVWVLGFVWETVADYQKFVFRKKQEGVIMSGLYRYSRFPNYFGEITLWWGIFLIALPVIYGYGWLVVVGPLYLMGILLFWSGIPTIEKRYEKKYGTDRAYRSYVQRTNKLIPWFPKT